MGVRCDGKTQSVRFEPEQIVTAGSQHLPHIAVSALVGQKR